jgi:5-methylcytosine-specific restriction endonuclease McrA
MPRQKASKRCVYCGSDSALTVDHVVPKSRARELRIKFRVLDNPSNRVIACRSCNQEKGNMLPAEWFVLHPEYRARFMREARYLSDIVKRIAEVEE